METTTDVVLIADDEANILMLLEMELQAEGFSTIGCNDGAKALAQIRESTPAIALLDWNMPIITGLDVCRRLRDTGNRLRFHLFGHNHIIGREAYLPGIEHFTHSDAFARFGKIGAAPHHHRGFSAQFKSDRHEIFRRRLHHPPSSRRRSGEDEMIERQ